MTGDSWLELGVAVLSAVLGWLVGRKKGGNSNGGTQ